MEQLIATIEKGQPLFNAIARNKYLKAIRDGFISVIPIIIFSSIFCLVASVPNIWGFYWPDDINNALWKCYNYSMGILAIACAATTAKHFADAQNRDLPKNNQINFISCMCAAIIGFLLLSSDTIATDAASGFNTTYLGSKGLLTAFIAAFVTGIIYKFFIKRNITVKMPEQVPPNISQTFSPSPSASPSSGSLTSSSALPLASALPRVSSRCSSPCSPPPTATSASL